VRYAAALRSGAERSRGWMRSNPHPARLPDAQRQRI